MVNNWEKFKLRNRYDWMVRTEIKISMKKKYSACLYFKLLKSYTNKLQSIRLTKFCHIFVKQLMTDFDLFYSHLLSQSGNNTVFDWMVRTEIKISMKKKYSACLYFKLLKSNPNKYIYN
jgi:hypothetical protein